MRLFLGLMLLVMCGCATTKPIEPQKLTQIHRVGTISLLGDKINLVQVGTTVFNNVNSYDGVAEWNIDGFTVAEIQRQLAKNTSITPVPIAYQQSDFSEIYLSQLSFPYTDYDIGSSPILWTVRKAAKTGSTEGLSWQRRGRRIPRNSRLKRLSSSPSRARA